MSCFHLANTMVQFLTVALLCLQVLTAQANVKQCPITVPQRYADIRREDRTMVAWFDSPSTPPLAQAAYAFDVARVKCLIAAKADVNQMVQTKETGTGMERWALGAALYHTYVNRRIGVPDDMVTTVQLLLDAGANPKIKGAWTVMGLVMSVVGGCNDCGQPRDRCCPVPPNVLKLIKALAAAGADITDSLEYVIGNANIAKGYCDDSFSPGFVEVVDFLLAKGATVKDPARKMGNDFDKCPKLRDALLKAEARSG